MCCCYNFRKKALYRLLVNIAPNLSRLEVYHGFLFEQELIIPFKYRELIEDGDTGLYVVSYMKVIARVSAGLSLSTYDEYFLWYVPPE